MTLSINQQAFLDNLSTNFDNLLAAWSTALEIDNDRSSTLEDTHAALTGLNKTAALVSINLGYGSTLGGNYMRCSTLDGESVTEGDYLERDSGVGTPHIAQGTFEYIPRL